MHEILKQHYGLNAPALERLRSTGGGLKDVYRVRDGARTYVLKRYRADYRSHADVTAMHQAQAFLSAGGLPVVTAIPDRNGDLAVNAGDNSWVLYPFAPGRHLHPGKVTPAQAAALGESMARMDARLMDWPTDWPGAEPLQIYPADEKLAQFEALLHYAEQDRAPDGATCVDVLRARISGVQRLAPVAPRLLAMERQWVHGDPNEGNLLFKGGQVTAIFDFDNIRRAPRGFDFMYALLAFFPTPGPARDEYARAYFALVNAPAAERELYAYLRAYWLLCDIWPLDLRYLSPAACDPQWSLPDCADWWERELDATTEWLLRIG